MCQNTHELQENLSYSARVQMQRPMALNGKMCCVLV